jgi:hypothetical protein
MADIRDTRYFQLTTMDTTGVAQTYYAAWRPPTAVLFLIDDYDKAKVMFVIPVHRAEELRSKVQIGPDGYNGGIADVVEFSEVSRPSFGDVDLNGFDDRAGVLSIGTLLEV